LEKQLMSKINVLVIPSDKSGVGKYRSIDPHVILQNQYPDDFHIDILFQVPMDDINFWKKYQIVHFHRTIAGDYENTPKLLATLRSLGIVTIMDLDDYWLPGKEHPIHDLIVTNKIHEKIINNLRSSEYVMTTTPVFATEILKLNKNVVIFPNAINAKEPQFNEPTLPSDKLRFGWLGGSSHLHDLTLLESIFSKIHQHRNDAQFYVCGFDIRGTVTEINKQTGEQKQRPIKPEETVWKKYEEIFTNKYKLISPEYINFLDRFTEEDDSKFSNEFYRRVWTRPVQSYAKNYSKFDVSLAPIKNHIFNRVKSQLKVIEAGFYKKAIIASNIGPYTIDLKHSLNQGEFVDGNALLVDEGRNNGDWYKYVKKLINNPTWAEDLGERLYETVKDKYDLNVVTKNRAEFYKSIL
jgi:glycosyltransferase involved in cell wall biosynthesis